MESGFRYLLDLDEDELDSLLLGLNVLICEDNRLGCSPQDVILQSHMSLWYKLYKAKSI